MNNELIEKLQNINISSESAEVISSQWVELSYYNAISDHAAGWLILILTIIAVRAVWKKLSELN